MSDIEGASSAEKKGGGIVDRNVACASCGYNLRSLRVDGACPECGIAVNRTIDGDWLRYADREWLKRIAVALGRVCFCWKLMLGSVIVAFAFPLVVNRLVDRIPVAGPRIIDAVLMLAGLVGLGSLIISAISLRVLAQPEPLTEHRRVISNCCLDAINAIVVPVVIASLVLYAIDVFGLLFLPLMYAAVLSTVFMFIIWGHSLLVISRLLHLGNRCRENVPKQMRKLTIYRGHMNGLLVFFLIVLAIDWRAVATASGTAAPSDDQPLFSAMAAAFVWFLVIGLTKYLRGPVKEELVAGKRIDEQR